MIKSKIRQIMRRLGMEVKRYTPTTSDIARFAKLLHSHQIDLVLDVGANEGQYVKFLRELNYRGKVISFEPLSTAYQQLYQNSLKDPLWEVTTRAALGNYNGEITLNIASNSQSSSVLGMLDTHVNAAPNSVYMGSESVQIYRLDSIPLSVNLQDFKSIFLKVDVQGLEKEVIEGASDLLPQIKGIQIELSLVSLYQDQPLYQEMIQWLEKLGYELYSIIPTFTDPETARLLQIDGIFFKL